MKEQARYNDFRASRRMKDRQAIQEEFNAYDQKTQDGKENIDPTKIFPKNFFEIFEIDPKINIDHDAVKTSLEEPDHYSFLHKVANMNIATAIYAIVSRYPNQNTEFSQRIKEEVLREDDTDDISFFKKKDQKERLETDIRKEIIEQKTRKLKKEIIKQQLSELERSILSGILKEETNEPTAHELITMSEIIHMVHERNGRDRKRTIQQFHQKKFGSSESHILWGTHRIECVAMTEAEQEYATKIYEATYDDGDKRWLRGLPDIHTLLREESQPNPFSEPYLQELKKIKLLRNQLIEQQKEAEDLENKLRELQEGYIHFHEKRCMDIIEEYQKRELTELREKYEKKKEQEYAKYSWLPELAKNIIESITQRRDRKIKKEDEEYHARIVEIKKYYQKLRDAVTHTEILMDSEKNNDLCAILNNTKPSNWVILERDGYIKNIKEQNKKIQKLQRAIKQEEKEMAPLKKAAEIHASPLEKRLILASLYTLENPDTGSLFGIDLFGIDLLAKEITKEKLDEYWELYLQGKSPEEIRNYVNARTLLSPEEITVERLASLNECLRPSILQKLAQANEEHKSGATPEQIFQIAPSIEAEQCVALLKTGYKISTLLKYPWLISSHAENISDCMPESGRNDQEAIWCSRHAVVQPEGWNRKRVGEIMLTRLKAGIDHTLHDASYWLTAFNPPEVLPDGKQLRDKEAEIALLATMRSVGEDVRSLNPNDKSAIKKGLQKYRRWSDCFFDASISIPYQAILEIYEKGSGAPEHITMEELIDRAEKILREQYKGTDAQHMHDVRAKITSLLKELQEFEKEGKIVPPTPALIGPLRKLAQERIAYINDAQTWVQTHASTRRSLLIHAWSNRRLALLDGCRDNPTKIEEWAEINAIRASFTEREKAGTLPKNFTREDLKTYRKWVEELVRHYDGDVIIDTLARLKEKFNPIFEIPPMHIELGDGWVGEILRKDDPRGMTIGPDTGCCMTIKGAAKSCLRAGYEKPSYGFFLLTRDKTVVAQSFLYINKEEAEGTIVCDNIEANEGRDMNNVIKMYDTFFTQYISRIKEQSGTTFHRVHIGTGYTDVGLEALKQTIPVRMKDEKIYTDAKKQRLLLQKTG